MDQEFDSCIQDGMSRWQIITAVHELHEQGDDGALPVTRGDVEEEFDKYVLSLAIQFLAAAV